MLPPDEYGESRRKGRSIASKAKSKVKAGAKKLKAGAKAGARKLKQGAKKLKKEAKAAAKALRLEQENRKANCITALILTIGYVAYSLYNDPNRAFQIIPDVKDTVQTNIQLVKEIVTGTVSQRESRIPQCSSNSHIDYFQRHMDEFLNREDSQKNFVEKFDGEFPLNMVTAEIGSKGKLTSQIAKKIGCGKAKYIVAEPHPEAHKLTRSYLRKELYPDNYCITLEDFAFSEATKEVAIFGNGEKSSLHQYLGFEGKEMVSAITFDKFASMNQISNVDMLLLDFGGAEFMILKGSENLLKEHKINVILMKVNEMMNKSFWKSVSEGAKIESSDESDTIHNIVRYMDKFAYTGFIIGKNRLIPLSGPCFNAEFEVCANSTKTCSIDIAFVHDSGFGRNILTTISRETLLSTEETSD